MASGLVITAEAITNLLKNSKLFERVLDKVKIVTLCDGKCTAEFTVDETHTNSMGGLHGGMSATLVDCISTYALMSDNRSAVPNVSVDIHMTYIKGAKIGDEVVIEASTIKSGKTLAFLEVLLKNKKTGDVLVTGSHTKFLLR